MAYAPGGALADVLQKAMVDNKVASGFDNDPYFYNFSVNEKERLVINPIRDPNSVNTIIFELQDPGQMGIGGYAIDWENS
jgi:hypothetical protein